MPDGAYHVPRGEEDLAFWRISTTYTWEGVEPSEDGAKGQKSTRKQKIVPGHVHGLMLKRSSVGAGHGNQTDMCRSGAGQRPAQ